MNKYLAKADKIKLELSGQVDGLIIAGSIAHQGKRFLTSKTDLDLVAITDNITEISSLCGFSIDSVNSSLEYDLICIHYFSDDIDIGLFLIKPNSFYNLTKLKKEEILMLRNSIIHKKFKGNDFNGKTHEYGVPYKKLSIGYGVRYPIAFYKNSFLVLGVQPHLFLANPIIMYDNGIVEEGLDIIWRGHIKNFKNEIKRSKINNPSEENVLYSFYKFQSMSSEAKRNIIQKAREYL